MDQRTLFFFCSAVLVGLHQWRLGCRQRRKTTIKYEFIFIFQLCILELNQYKSNEKFVEIWANTQTFTVFSNTWHTEHRYWTIYSPLM